mgnify:CR=1 FL=1|jgi:diguanylate cyclase (GGDEF)-like protein
MARYALLDINVFAIIILLFVLNNYRNTLMHGDIGNRIFAYLLMFNIIILFVDVIAIPLWGLRGQFVHILLYITQLLFFSFAILLTLFWLYYCIYRITKTRPKSLFIKYILPVPCMLFIIFMFATIGKGYIFYITPMNEYVRGPLFHISTIFGYIYIAAAFLLVLIKRKNLNKKELFPYLMLPIVPLVLGLVQAYYFLSVTITWPATAIVLFGIQLYVLDNKTTTDHLTGLNNRMSMDTYLKRLIDESLQRDEPLGIIMLDIDNFKRINDEHGHPEGDKALVSASNILRDCMLGKNFIARYGGDEFIIIISECNKLFMETTLDAIYKEAEKHNKHSHKHYKIEFSIGESIFYPNELSDIHSILQKVDKLMYENKNSKKESNLNSVQDIY